MRSSTNAMLAEEKDMCSQQPQYKNKLMIKRTLAKNNIPDPITTAGEQGYVASIPCSLRTNSWKETNKDLTSTTAIYNKQTDYKKDEAR